MSKIEGLDKLNNKLDNDILAILKEKLPGLNEEYVKWMANLVLTRTYNHVKDVLLLLKKDDSVVS